MNCPNCNHEIDDDLVRSEGARLMNLTRRFRRGRLSMFRGKHFGVFEGVRGYYVSKIEKKKPINKRDGDGWGMEILMSCNKEAKDLEEYAELQT